MGSTNGVQPSWRLATITMQTIPNASCHQRFPADAATRMSAVLIAVTAASLFLYWLFLYCLYWRPERIPLRWTCAGEWTLGRIDYCAVAVGRLSRINFYCDFPR